MILYDLDFDYLVAKYSIAPESKLPKISSSPRWWMVMAYLAHYCRSFLTTEVIQGYKWRSEAIRKQWDDGEILQS